METKYQWLIINAHTINKTDYLLWGDNDYDIPTNHNDSRYYYNQWKLYRTRNACTLYWSAGAISDLTWYFFPEKELLDIVDLAEREYWWKENVWMYMYKAVDCLRKWWNDKFPSNKLTSFRISIWDSKFKEALQKWHSLVVWYRTSNKYYDDSEDDGKIEWLNFPKDGWWHLVRTNQSNTSIKIDDNYVWEKKYNTYINNNIVELKDKWVFLPYAYIFLKDISVSNKIRDNIDLEWARNQFDKWLWNWLNPREPISRQEVMTIIDRLIKRNNAN